MSISTPFIRRPIATSLVAAAIFLMGLAAYPLLPVAPLPNVTFPTLTVTAQYPGASPETMASTIATPLETEFGQMLPGLSQMTSTSVLGTTQITLQFDLSTNLGNAETLLLEAINAAQGSLPKDMPSPPTFRAINPADSPILIRRRSPMSINTPRTSSSSRSRSSRVWDRCWLAASRRRRSACRWTPRGWRRWA
jgi:HAE1 family hydrophobic/amphiphilic exporter-1